MLIYTDTSLWTVFSRTVKGYKETNSVIIRFGALLE